MGGIGAGIVTVLTQRGFDAVVCDRAIDPAMARDLTERAAPGARLAFAAGELADLADHGRFVDAVYGAFGRIDCLVNNAGVSALSRGDLLDVTAESYDRNFSVNTRGTFFLTQAVCRRMLQAPGDFPEGARSVVFISSSNAAIAAPDRGEYAMSKAAVGMMAKLFAIRLAPHGIAVHDVRPGLIRTPMTAVAQARYDRLLAAGLTPFNRWGTPDDVGHAVATLAAGDLPFATGMAIQIDGGMHIQHY
jgi:NAD(P)-dependent dehydrogenase (short-subunit alcohol dehydrogenase family)